MLVVLMLMLPIAPSGVQRAEAQLGFSGFGSALGGLFGGGPEPVIEVGVNTAKAILSEVSNAISAHADKSLLLKEFTLDNIARAVAQSALNQLTADMIEWINGGMNGNPAFVTNLDDFLMRIADETAGSFIYGPELDNLCVEVEFQVRAALHVQYAEEGRGVYTPQCTLVKASADVEAFLNGDFSKGGWGAYFELMVGSNNDPIKAYYDAQIEQYTRISNAQENRITKLNWSDGVFSKQQCEFIEDATGFSRKRCEDLTPAFLVRDALSFIVGEAPAQRLLDIDEFKEVFGALASSLTNQAIQGTFGLLGLGGNPQYTDERFGSNGGSSYLDGLRGEDIGVNASTPSTVQAIEDALTATRDYIAVQEEIIADVEDLEEQLAEGEADSPSCFNLDLPSHLAGDKGDAEENKTNALGVVTHLTTLKTDITNATSSAAINQLYAIYLEFERQGLIQTDYDVQKLRTEFIDMNFNPRVAAFQEEIDQELASCN